MLEKLFDQYKQIMGFKNLTLKELKNPNFKKEFILWIQERQKYGYRYLDFLYEINQQILDRTTAEVGKTELDSIVMPFDTTIISEGEFEDIEDKSRLIRSKFIVYEEMPVLYFDSCNYPKLVALPERRIDTFMTQNPYSPYSISNWNGLHNSGNFDIVVGVYGDIHDKNIENNLKMLELLKEGIIGNDYKFDYNTDGNIYYAAVASKRKIKTIGSRTI